MAYSITSNKRRGDSLLLALIYTAVISIIVLAVMDLTGQNQVTISRRINQQHAIHLAEAGIEKAVWCLNNPANTTNCPGNPSYTGETFSLSNGSVTVTVSGFGGTRTVVAQGTRSGIGGTTTKELTVTLMTTTAEAAFQYGLQVGVGGVEMQNNNVITGNVYSNGSIDGDNNSRITGDVVLAPGNSTVNAESNPSPYTTTNFGNNTTQYVVQSFVPTVSDKVYEIDLKIARTASAPSDATVMLYSDSSNNPGSQISGASVSVPAATFPTNIPGTWESGWTEVNFTPGTALTAGTRYWLVVRLSSTTAGRYYTQLHADATDATYIDGTARYGTSATSGLSPLCTGGCDVAFRIRMGGTFPTLTIDDGVGGNAYANTIANTTIDKHACYQNIVGTVRANGGSETCTVSSAGAIPCVSGNTATGVPPYCHPGNPDAPPAAFPLTSAQIAQFEALAAQGGTTNCPTGCTINSGTMGPRKYVGNVTIDGTVTLTGNVWVDGNLTVDGTLALSDGYGNTSGTVVVDHPADQSSSGRIFITNNAELDGNSQPNTYILLLSANTGMTEASPAIDVDNSLTAGVLYASNGAVVMKNSASLNELTAQKVIMKNNATITYTSGLASVIFSSGPGAAWIYQRGSYRITQ